MKKFFENNKMLLECLWIVLMALMCVVDIYMLGLEWNLYSFISLILCSLSSLMTLASIIFKKYYKGDNNE